MQDSEHPQYSNGHPPLAPGGEGPSVHEVLYTILLHLSSEESTTSQPGLVIHLAQGGTGGLAGGQGGEGGIDLLVLPDHQLRGQAEQEQQSPAPLCTGQVQGGPYGGHQDGP